MTEESEGLLRVTNITEYKKKEIYQKNMMKKSNRWMIWNYHQKQQKQNNYKNTFSEDIAIEFDWEKCVVVVKLDFKWDWIDK